MLVERVNEAFRVKLAAEADQHDGPSGRRERPPAWFESIADGALDLSTKFRKVMVDEIAETWDQTGNV